MFNNFLNKEKKGQGALEYLLIIGGALIVAVIVVTLILSMGRSNNEKAIDSQHNYEVLIDNTITPPIITDIVCTQNNITIYMIPSPDKGVKGYKIKYDSAILPSDAPDVFLTYGDGNISYNFTSEKVLGETHKISVIALKNDVRSRPSTPSMSCKTS